MNRIVAMLFLVTLTAAAQRSRGELHIEVRDPQGAALASAGELVSEANHFRRTFPVGAEGRYVFQDLPFGVYRLSVTAEGFAPWTNLVEIRSEIPVRIAVTPGVAPVTTQVRVTDSATLVDPYRTGTLYTIGQQAVNEQAAARPGREVLDLVAAQPGWVYEANGVLHPRGSEYDVQFVLDGLPLTQNRSPAFAPSVDADDVESVRILTANYPAEYGRKLGGVVELATEKDMPEGLHARFAVGGGSFSNSTGDAEISYLLKKDRFSVSGSGFHTNRYLDPPVLENFTNAGNGDGFSASYERDFSDRDRLRLTVSQNEARFMVPDELVQEEADQRQNAGNKETAGQIYFQHTISANLFLSISGSVRDASATLTSNPLSTPVIVTQDRGYHEGYARADLAGHHGHHDWKVGLDSIFSPVQETMAFRITDSTQFDPATQQQFQFSARRWDIEPSVYAQDQVHLGKWNVSAGLRFDHYRLVVSESAWSPRVGVSRYLSSLSLLVHASYDRVFQTPAVENLLLASSPLLNSIDPVVLRLPVRPAQGNFYEAGVTKALGGKLRVDANLFRRDFRNYSDDDVLLDTGVSFPIAFAKGQIVGEEVRLEVPEWGRFSGFLSYANQSGVGQGPITGGLFLGSDAVSGLTDTSRFAVSQDQRTTLHGRVRFQATKKAWLAFGGEYGSGLPVDLGSGPPDINFLTAQFGTAIVDQVDFNRGRVRPNFSFDAATGAEIYHKEQRSAALQIQVSNLADRVNVLNFASLFSGAAVAPTRSVSARLRLAF